MQGGFFYFMVLFGNNKEPQKSQSINTRLKLFNGLKNVDQVHVLASPVKFVL
jgi:hypothetical protein